MLRKTHRFRIVLLAALSLVTFAVLEARLYYLQVADHETYASRADYQQHKTIRLPPRRGDILDRNGHLLASSHFTETIVLDTRKAPEGKPNSNMIRDLAEALGKPVDTITGYFEHPGRRYVYRKAPDDVVSAINEIEARYDLPGGLIDLESASRRDYPNGSLAAHVIGFTTIDKFGSDNIGLAGIEKEYNDWLAGDYRDVPVQTSGGLRRSRLSAISDEALAATYGHNVVLTIDQRIQSLAEAALSRAVGQYQAKGGVAVVMDVTNGEILALVNCPDFNLNTFRDEKIDPSQLRDRALTDPIEVGSVMKIITSALLLDKGLVTPDEIVNGHNGEYYLRGRRILDDHDLGMVPFREAFTFSSNIIMATLADARLEPPVYYDGLRRFGLGRKTGVDLAGEGNGIMYPLDKWTSMSPASLAFGYEIALTPLQVVTALGAIGNNGWRMKPHVVREIDNAKGQAIQKFKPEPLGRVVGPQTCKTVLGLMESVVLEGTAKREGQVPGYRVGGKTGTTVKHTTDADGHKLYIASFAGLAPIDSPKLAIYVYVDEPHGAKYGGDVAAPVFREICEGALPLLQIPPSDPKAWEEFSVAREKGRPGAILAAYGPDAATTPTATGNEVADAVEVADASPPPAARPALPGLSPEPTGPVMPDCKGMTILDAWDAVGKAGIPARMLGSGIAVSQDPPAGTRLAEGQTAKVIFAHLATADAPAAAAETSSAAKKP